jgi:hypothetical protein
VVGARDDLVVIGGFCIDEDPSLGGDVSTRVVEA